MKKLAATLAAILLTTGAATAGSMGDFAAQLQFPAAQTEKSDLDLNSTGSIKRPVAPEPNQAEKADQR